MELKQVQKRTAKKLYNAGIDVLFIPCKCNPYNTIINLGIWQNRNDWGQYKNFDILYNAYQNYNCNFETGTYIHFYIKC